MENAIQVGSDEYNGIEQIHNRCVHPPSRQIWVHGFPFEQVDISDAGTEPGIEYRMATQFQKNLHILRIKSETDLAIVHLQTCGGDYTEGMAMFDTAKSMPFPIVMISYTHARSMSSILLQAADYRLLMPNSYFLMHYGSLTLDGEAKTVQSNAEFDKQCTEKMLDIYVEKALTGRKFARNKKQWTETTVRAHIKQCIDRKGNFFLTAPEAINWGFADAILENWHDQIEAVRKKLTES
jgi:ATP-dependent protease ClpP protease subunit